MSAEKALKILLRNKKIFIACYNLLSEGEVDLESGDLPTFYKVDFAEGAVLSASEVKSFLKEQVGFDVKDVYLLMEETHDRVSLSTRITIFSEVYKVKNVFTSFYAAWSLLRLEKVQNATIFQPEVVDFRATHRVKAYLDELVSSVKYYYYSTKRVFPSDLVLWPIAGFELADAVTRLYPLKTSVQISDNVTYVELGRNSGFQGLGTVDGSYTKKAVDCQQCNKEELRPFLEIFNRRMGRL